MMQPGDPILDKDTPLQCAKCGQSMGQCKCPDADERLQHLRKTKYNAFRWCSVCDHHYARCHCEHPFWVRSDTGEPMVEANNIQKIMEANGL